MLLPALSVTETDIQPGAVGDSDAASSNVIRDGDDLDLERHSNPRKQLHFYRIKSTVYEIILISIAVMGGAISWFQARSPLSDDGYIIQLRGGSGSGICNLSRTLRV